MWPVALSGRLPVKALVGHHPTNKLIGREPIPDQKIFPNPHMREKLEYPVLAPVSEGYPKDWGRLLTCYSPVRHSSTPERAFPFDLHVLSTPPAFVLSQDQTLQKEFKTRHKNTDPNWPMSYTKRNNHSTKPQPSNNWHWHKQNTLLNSQKTNTHRHSDTNNGAPPSKR